VKGRADCTGKVAAVGFCYGGSIANVLATRLPDLKGAVPFYGGQPKAEDVPNIKAPLLLHYAENDERVNAGWPAYEAALKANKVSYEAYIYPDDKDWQGGQFARSLPSDGYGTGFVIFVLRQGGVPADAPELKDTGFEHEY